MSNKLKMATANAIVVLWRRGWSYRRIARELGIHRETVRRYVKGALEESKPAKVTAGDLASRSTCEPFRKLISDKVGAGLSAQRVYQDLVCEHGFAASYESVKRFARRLRKRSSFPFRRMECLPGEEAQVDFGKGAPVLAEDGRKRFPYVFRIVLSYSRKAYSEVVWRQTTESFIRCLENAFRHFGGVPRTIVIDSLRAAVSKADWYDPELNPKVEEFCRYYGTVILPTKPYTPRHKGKVEREIGYVRNNALKGHTFKSLSEENLHLLQWESRVADHRIHGTTRKQVKKIFLEQERPALLPLPAMPFPFFHEGERSVHRDAHVEVDKAYYSVPPEYVGRSVWVRWDCRLVRIFNQRMEQIAVHVKRDMGRFSTDPAHIASEKISSVERGAEFLLRRVTLIGTHSAKWAEAVLERRGVQGVRVLLGLLSLTGRYRSLSIENACQKALLHGSLRLRDIRNLIEHHQNQGELHFLEEHPIIRDISDYAKAVKISFRQEGGKIIDEFTAFEAASGDHEEKSPAQGQA
ncbi:MAG: IS21 family transposase, partial [Deltaproteobacteria bacterium]|nr:IS21 family transposase [Deltaproteobacteria bacterium]